MPSKVFVTSSKLATMRRLTHEMISTLEDHTRQRPDGHPCTVAALYQVVFKPTKSNPLNADLWSLTWLQFTSIVA
jgi:hypothetical protein